MRPPTTLVVDRQGPVVTWCPPASTSPHLLRIAHDTAGARFDLADDAAIDAVAVALARRTPRVCATPWRRALQHGRAHRAAVTAAPFHWYVEVTPRVSVIAGFEQATGILVNTVPPEQAAATFRATHSS